MGTRYATKDAALYHVQRGKTYAEAAGIVGTAKHVVERWCRYSGVSVAATRRQKRRQKRAPSWPRVELQPESVKRVHVLRVVRR